MHVAQPARVRGFAPALGQEDLASPVSALALTQFPEFSLQRPTRLLLFPQAVPRLPQLAFGLRQTPLSLS